MIELGAIERLIELCLISGYIKDESYPAPLSLILISRPECAKTSMLLKFRCPQTFETTDLSSKPINDFIIPKLRRDELHHIIIPDMIKVLSHRATTVASTIAFLNALMEEGLLNNLFMGQIFEFKDRKYCGLITAITIDYYYKVFRQWREIGFTTRFIPASYEYSDITVAKIHESIMNNETISDLTKLKKVGKKRIFIDDESRYWINNKANDIANAQSNETITVNVQGGKQKRVPIKIYGFRLHKQLRKLAQSIALSHGETKVTSKHITELRGLIPYIALPKNRKVI